jgi:3'(2'), 5'-bisphosphate nucleotidase
MISLQKAEIRFAVAAVREASLLVKHIQAEMVSPALTKEDRSPVTIADFASQAMVANLLEKNFPADPLVGEENADTLRTPEAAETLAQVTQFVTHFAPGADSGEVCAWIDRGAAQPAHRFWTLDPIDGTKGFLRGDQYVVALALLVDYQVQVGVLGCPNLSDGWQPDFAGPGSLIVAARGEGSWVLPLQGSGEPRKLSVSGRSDPAQARLLRSFESGHTNVSQIDVFAELLHIQAEPVRMDSQAKYAVLAAGRGDLMLRLLSPQAPDYREKIWDQAAGSLVIEEAGGQVSDLQGRALDFSTGRMLANNRGVLASNGLLHPAALHALLQMNA